MMGTVIQATHECGYPLIEEEIVERVDVTSAEDIPEVLRGHIRYDQLPPHLHRYREVGRLLFWYDGTYNAEHEVKQCPQCGASLPLYRKQDEPKIEIEPLGRGRYRLFSWYSGDMVVLTAADLLDLARWVEQQRQTLENEL